MLVNACLVFRSASQFEPTWRQVDKDGIGCLDQKVSLSTEFCDKLILQSKGNVSEVHCYLENIEADPAIYHACHNTRSTSDSIAEDAVSRLFTSCEPFVKRFALSIKILGLVAHVPDKFVRGKAHFIFKNGEKNCFQPQSAPLESEGSMYVVRRMQYVRI